MRFKIELLYLDAVAFEWEGDIEGNEFGYAEDFMRHACDKLNISPWPLDTCDYGFKVTCIERREVVRRTELEKTLMLEKLRRENKGDPCSPLNETANP